MPNALASHYSRFRVAERLLLSGHSHQAWPDVAFDGMAEAFEDAATLVDDKWGRAFEKADEVRDGFRRLLGDPGGEVALAASTHDLVLRWLSALDLLSRPRVVTTDGEFHTLRRQLGRLAEEGLEVVRVEAPPVETLADRLAAEVDSRTTAVLVSAVLFESSRIVPSLGALAAACADREVELLVDAYHALGCIPFDIHSLGLGSAWVIGGGYKYLQLGEGNCFLRIPPHGLDYRPAITGWFAEFAALADEPDPSRIQYGPGASRFAGATYDPTSHYRAARVFGFFEEQGLTPERLRESYQRQVGLLAARVDGLGVPDEVLVRDRATPLDAFGGFLALQSPFAGDLQRELHSLGVQTDSRGRWLRLGPAPYLADEQITSAVDLLGRAVEKLRH